MIEDFAIALVAAGTLVLLCTAIAFITRPL
jgi:hypothetical protein